LVKFRSDVVGSVNSLGCSKCAFYLISLADGSLLILCVCVVLFLGRPAQWTVVAIDVAGLDVLPVLFPQIELVGLNLLGQHTKTPFVEFQLHTEVRRFVIGIPANMVHVGVTAHNAGTDLRPELNRGLRLASDNGTEMRLVDADDAVGTSADVLLEHHFLLFIHLESCLKTFVVMAAEASKKCACLFAQEIKKQLEVCLQASYLD